MHDAPRDRVSLAAGRSLLRTDDLSGFEVLPGRWVVARILAWIAEHHRWVRDYETLPAHHEAMAHLAMIITRRLART